MLSARFVFLIIPNELAHNSSKYKAFDLPLTTSKYVQIKH